LQKGPAADGGIVNPLIEEHLDGLPELQSRGVQITEGPQTLVFAFGLRVMDNVSDHEVEQVQGVIQRNDFEGMRKGEQRRQPALWRHARNGLGPCGGGIPG
jgi:hypothetical protein